MMVSQKGKTDPPNKTKQKTTTTPEWKKQGTGFYAGSKVAITDNGKTRIP